MVKQTLQDIGAGDKPVYLVFNKVDAYTYVKKDEDDLTPATRENLSLDDLKKSWIARANTPCIFLSALAKHQHREIPFGSLRDGTRDPCRALPLQQLPLLTTKLHTYDPAYF